jgi:hypothetical protein
MDMIAIMINFKSRQRYLFLLNKANGMPIGRRQFKALSTSFVTVVAIHLSELLL